MNTESSPADWETELMDVLMRAKYIRHLYRQYYKDQFPYSVDAYIDIIARKTGYDIDIRSVSWESSGLIRGVCMPFDGHKAIIRVPLFSETGEDHGATLCEQRFIALKEAAHLEIDEDDSYVEDCLELVNSIVFQAPYASVDELKKDERSDVFYGKIFAMEVLFPAEYREEAKRQIENGESTYNIAKRFLVPEKELIWFLSDRVHPGLERFRKLIADVETRFASLVHPEAT